MSISAFFLSFPEAWLKENYFLKHANHSKNTQKLHFGLLSSSSPAREEGWAAPSSPALEQPSREGTALLSADGALIENRNEKYFPEGVWHYGSLVWNQLGRGQGLWLVSPCNVSFSLLEISQLVLRDGSVPRKLFVMISLLAFVYKLLYNLNVSIQNLKCTGFVQPEAQMKFSLGSWQDLLSHLSNWQSNQRSKNTAKISGAVECLEKPWQECCFSFPLIIKFIYTSEQTSAWSI